MNKTFWDWMVNARMEEGMFARIRGCRVECKNGRMNEGMWK